MFELNLASLPNHILYLEGVQLSYIKVFVHIFNLWQCDKPCFLSNPELVKRTNLHLDTVKSALQFFEKKNIFKSVKTVKKCYLQKTPKAVDFQRDSVDNLPVNCSNIARGGELDPPPGGVRPPHQAELDPHNIKTNIKYNKSFCSSNDKKINNQKPSSGFSSVESQSNSYNPESMNKIVPISPLMAEVIKNEELQNDQRRN